MTHRASQTLRPCISAIAALVLFFFAAANLQASDLSDAEALRARCEKEAAEIEVPLKNFGDQAERDEYGRGAAMIKLGKVKFLQSKYLEASESFNKYLLLQQGLYKSLAKKYLERTETMLDDIAVELIDSSDPKIEEYLRLANQNFKDAQRENTAERHKNAIKLCRISKSYALSGYGAAGKAMPEQYGRDAADNDNRPFK
jgi:hypothetical protein